MTLLEDIQNSAIDRNSDLGTVLRKCKLLAARLGSQQLEDWLLLESNGYPGEADLPSYRIWPILIKGNFSGPFSSGASNVEIPSIAIPEQFRERFYRYECRESITRIETLVTNNKNGGMRVSLGDLAVVLGMNVYKNLNCYAAWGEYDISSYVEVVNTVRNRVLGFALEIWKNFPQAGEIATGTIDIPQRLVTHVFNTTILNSSVGMIGTANSSIVEVNVIQNDIDSLADILKENKVSSEDVEKLREILHSGEKPNLEGKYGPRVAGWLSRMVEKAAIGAWDIAVGAAGGILAQAINKYYGIA